MFGVGRGEVEYKNFIMMKPVIIFCIAMCESPSFPTYSLLKNTPSRNLEGAKVTFKCKSGYFPSHLITSTCNEKSVWFPDPELHTCTKSTGNGEVFTYYVINSLFFTSTMFWASTMF